MAISIISVSFDSLEDSMGTPAGRVILFGTIPTTIHDTTPSMILPTTHIDTTSIPIVSPTIPPSPDYTPASPDYSPASDIEFDPSEDPSSDHIPPLPATLPFLSSIDDSSDSDIPDTPPSPTHDTPFTETTLSTQRSPVASSALRRRVMILSPGQPIPHDALSNSASSHSSSNHSLLVSLSGTRSSHRLCSLVASVHRSPAAIPKRPSHDSSSVSSSRKRSRSPVASIPSPESATDLEGCSEDSFEPYVPREVGLGVNVESAELSKSRGTDLEIDVDVESSDGIDIDPEVQAEINECIAYADALRDRGIDARVVVEAIDREEITVRRVQ
ncbi:hypothetical protein Tco_1536255, partial [Tanacetum coccineum]